jgi:hypothetical protein
VAALAALSPAWLSYTRITKSELVYALLATAALLCLDAEEVRADGRRRTARLLLGAVLVGGALLTRSIGVSLALAAVATPLLRRRFRDALLIGAAILACVAPWWAFQSSAEARNGELASSFLVAYELGYSGWLPKSFDQALRVAQQNLLRLGFSLGYFQLALPVGQVRAAIAEGGARLLLLHAICWSSLLLVLWGFWLSARRGIRTLHLYAAVYGGIILLWTFSPHRFLVPWTPFGLFFAATGVRAALRGRWPARFVLAAVLALFLAEDWKMARSSERDYAAREVAIDWTELRDVESFLRENTEPGDVIASAHPERIFLTTGRQGHYFWPVNDPVAFDYGPHRVASRFAILPAPGEARARRRQVIERVVEVYRDARIAWYVDWGALEHARAFSAAARGAPGRFELRHTTPGGSFAIYRVRIPER